MQHRTSLIAFLGLGLIGSTLLAHTTLAQRTTRRTQENVRPAGVQGRSDFTPSPTEGE
ncbi:MAG: hypothetical protein KDB61_03390 [Planctomycetes bacterium]|nr:hypothetical protein [Planctomycetota bacterium]